MFTDRLQELSDDLLGLRRQSHGRERNVVVAAVASVGTLPASVAPPIVSDVSTAEPPPATISAPATAAQPVPYAEVSLQANLNIAPAGSAPAKVTKITPALPICNPDYKTRDKKFKKPVLLPIYHYGSPTDATFALFADFPTEIRLLIWHFASFAVRIVEIQYINRTTGFRLGASPRPPTVLQVCHESRMEALKVYRLCFGTKKLPKSIHINPFSDILFLRQMLQTHAWRCIRGPNSLWKHELENIRRIAIISRNTSSMKFLRKTVCSFPNLEELIVLWTASIPTTNGRGVNHIEHVPHHLEYGRCGEARNRALGLKDDIVTTWDREQWWQRVGRKPPEITVRHWCIREEGAV